MSLWYPRKNKLSCSRKMLQWYTAYIDYYHNYSYDTWEPWSTTIYFPDKSGVGGVRLPVDSISLNGPIIKPWECGMIVYIMEISNPKFPFVSTLTKFQRCVFKKIHGIHISPDVLIKIPYSIPPVFGGTLCTNQI